MWSVYFYPILKEIKNWAKLQDHFKHCPRKCGDKLVDNCIECKSKAFLASFLVRSKSLCLSIQLVYPRNPERLYNSFGKEIEINEAIKRLVKDSQLFKFKVVWVNLTYSGLWYILKSHTRKAI